MIKLRFALKKMHLIPRPYGWAEWSISWVIRTNDRYISITYSTWPCYSLNPLNFVYAWHISGDMHCVMIWFLKRISFSSTLWQYLSINMCSYTYEVAVNAEGAHQNSGRMHCCCWRYKYPKIMMTSWNGNIFRVNGHVGEIHGSPVKSPHKGQWRGALMLSLICVRISDWVNDREAGDLKRNRAHYDAIVM